MTIPADVWQKYAKSLSKINAEAARLVSEWVEKYGLEDVQASIDYSFVIAKNYGEAAAAWAAQVYDELAEFSEAYVPAAEVAETASYSDVAKTINGVLKQSQNASLIGSSIGRLVKKAGADTTLKNASRDRAQYAWIAIGDTCPFCLGIAAEGWKTASGSKGATEHLHGNCDCTYSVRFNKDTKIAGYDPERYQRMFDNAEGDTEEEKLNYLRREAYAENKEEISAQKRDAYEKRQELDSSAAEEIDAG